MEGVAVGRDHADWQAALGSGLDQSWILDNEHGSACIDGDGVPSQGKQTDVKGQPSMEGKSDMHIQHRSAVDRKRPDKRWG